MCVFIYITNFRIQNLYVIPELFIFMITSSLKKEYEKSHAYTFSYCSKYNTKKTPNLVSEYHSPIRMGKENVHKEIFSYSYALKKWQNNITNSSPSNLN